MDGESFNLKPLRPVKTTLKPIEGELTCLFLRKFKVQKGMLAPFYVPPKVRTSQPREREVSCPLVCFLAFDLPI
jgi:hypothetical protein